MVEVQLVETGDPEAEFAFDPAHVTVEPGTTVRWTLTHDTFHTVTNNATEEHDRGELFDETLSSEGDTFERTFEEPGTYAYHCQPHAGFMFGEVVVEGEESQADETPGVGLIAILALSVLTSLALRAWRR